MTAEALGLSGMLYAHNFCGGNIIIVKYIMRDYVGGGNCHLYLNVSQLIMPLTKQ